MLCHILYSNREDKNRKPEDEILEAIVVRHWDKKISGFRLILTGRSYEIRNKEDSKNYKNLGKAMKAAKEWCEQGWSQRTLNLEPMTGLTLPSKENTEKPKSTSVEPVQS